jgi:ABC-type nitrate/sulfonate/bicarbonate transport system substrate-binding protein
MDVKTKIIVSAVVALLVGTGIGIGLGFVIKPEKSGMPDIKYGAQYYPGEFLLYGHSQFWEDYNLDVEHRLFASGGENNAALIAGEVDINCGSDSKTVALFSSIPDEALLIGTIQRGDRYSTIIKDDASYTDWGDLVGETVGTKLGTGAEQVLRRYFDTQSYGWDDFTWVNMDVTQMASALDNGEIEAFTAWEPTPSVAVDQGIGKVLRSFGDIALTPASIHTTKDFAYNNPGAVVSFLAAHLDKYDMITTDTANAAQIASDAAATKSTTISAGAFELIFNKIDFQVGFNESIIEAIEDTAEFQLANGKITEIPEIVWDTRFIDAAMELQEDFGTPVTGLSLEEHQVALNNIVDKYFNFTSEKEIALSVLMSTTGIAIIVPSLIGKRRSF